MCPDESCELQLRHAGSITCTNSLIGTAASNDALSHIPREPSTDMLVALPFCLLLTVGHVQGFCGDNIKWSHNFNIEDAYGMWYGVGYAQHTPDLTNKPNTVGCVTLHITDVTTEPQDDWLDWSIQKHNYSDENWRSYKSNPWSEDVLSGSWLDIRVKRKAKRDIYNERRLRVVWDEDGQSVEQVYLYTPEAPGLWTADQRRPLEREMLSRGIDVWNPDEPPRHPQVIRILKVKQNVMIINHCSEISGAVFSLILRRSPSRVDRWEWFDYKRQFFNFELPNVYRYSAVCAGCIETSSVIFVLMSAAVFVLL
ncbi:uncharacterized protein LOC110384011 [Helicoverpa armigera]|uniref:uncharacterized protein LOC110384011 n=1 Tax=Helicoverpa armigera TaxID=29058 RepID=UPI003083C39D